MATIKAQIEFDVTDGQISEAVERAIQNHPDYVMVVRCKDCEHFVEKGGVLEPWCDWNEARLFDGDGFCSDGKRKDGDG